MNDKKPQNMLLIIVVVVVALGAIAFFTQYKPQSNNVPASSPSPQVQEQVPSTQTDVSTKDITIKNFAFDPKVATISVGTTVTWTNQDSVNHNIKSDTFNSQELAQGDTFSFTFNSKGTYQYSCGIHPNMTATIVVQ